MPRKKIVKKPIKQKQKVSSPRGIGVQRTKVSQNVKVVIGDVKRKRAVKSAGPKPVAKPPIVLNISNPQPYNNMFMDYFKQQLKNQQPIKANTLAQQEKINEQEETKAAKAGVLSKNNQEPNDVARELKRQEAAARVRLIQADLERTRQEQEVASSIKKPKRTPKRKTRLRLLDDSQDDQENPFLHLVEQQQQPEEPENNMLNAMEQQKNQMEEAIGAGGAGEENAYQTPIKPGGAGAPAPKAKRGPKPSDLPTPQPDKPREDLLDYLSQFDESQLQKKLKGKKLNDYAKVLGLRTHTRGESNPTAADDRRQGIIGLVINYKRDRQNKK